MVQHLLNIVNLDNVISRIVNCESILLSDKAYKGKRLVEFSSVLNYLLNSRLINENVDIAYIDIKELFDDINEQLGDDKDSARLHIYDNLDYTFYDSTYLNRVNFNNLSNYIIQDRLKMTQFNVVMYRSLIWELKSLTQSNNIKLNALALDRVVNYIENSDTITKKVLKLKYYNTELLSNSQIIINVLPIEYSNTKLFKIDFNKVKNKLISLANGSKKSTDVYLTLDTNTKDLYGSQFDNRTVNTLLRNNINTGKDLVDKFNSGTLYDLKGVGPLMLSKIYEELKKSNLIE